MQPVRVWLYNTVSALFFFFFFFLPSPFSHRTRMEARPTPSFNAFGWKKLFIQFLELRLVKLRAKEIVNSLADEVGRRISMEEIVERTHTHVHTCPRVHSRTRDARTSHRREGNNNTGRLNMDKQRTGCTKIAYAPFCPI